jgi:uncharacterized protein
VKIVIPGGSGQVGEILGHSLTAAGHEVVVLSRNPKSKGAWRTVEWDGESVGAWASEIEGADAVINLAGRSVNCRYNAPNRQEMLESRTRSTRAIGKAIRDAKRPPAVWLQMSTATIYSHRYDAPNDEVTGILGGMEEGAPDSWRFSIDVATSWERVAIEIETPQTRKVLLRTAVVMSPDRGGAFDILLSLVRRGLGGRNGNGRQYVSWIHDRDFVRAIHWLIEHELLEGPVNLAAPNPLPNVEFMATLREAAGVRIGLPASRWMLELGAVFLRTETELILKSRRVVPARLLASGFVFSFPAWPAAAVDLSQRFRNAART